MRLIDADELLEHAYRDRLDSRELIAEMINNAPTVKEIPYKIPIEFIEKILSLHPERKTGRWILHENQRQEDVDNGNYLYICSECGKSDIHAKTQKVPFCWWCGAKLEGEHE